MRFVKVTANTCFANATHGLFRILMRAANLARTIGSGV
jgi:hypothetical protein